ncbi:hypothetical protein [Paenibacillus yanchengensis]|uniref:Sigma-70 family RNA polymerase sigma factor n=1 Tax=Paenibacillus yanchengensis TaxID=2035833 RepID=A0ABW4YKZ9_9BACL
MVQSELFPIANKQEIERTRFWLEKYTHMVSLMSDFEQNEKAMQQVAIDGEVARRIDQEDLHADKTANAAVLLEKQRWVYEQYSYYTRHLQRAAALIQDIDERVAIDYRYMEGHSFKETALYLRRSIGDASTVRRKINKGIESMANTLKLLGFFEHDDKF